MSTEEDCVNLSNLPSDIVRGIIEKGKADINSMRLISRRWNNLAIENLSNRKSHPPIKWLGWSNHSFNDEIFMSMRIPFGLHSYFGVDTWMYQKGVRPDDSEEVKFSGVVKRTKMDFSRLVNRCSRIETIEVNISMKARPAEIRHFATTIRDIPIETLAVTGYFDAGEECLAILIVLLTAGNIKRITLSQEFFDPRHILDSGVIERKRNYAFIFKAVQLVEEIQIHWMGTYCDWDLEDSQRIKNIINRTGNATAHLEIVNDGYKKTRYLYRIVAPQ